MSGLPKQPAPSHGISSRSLEETHDMHGTTALWLAQPPPGQVPPAAPWTSSASIPPSPGAQSASGLSNPPNQPPSDETRPYPTGLCGSGGRRDPADGQGAKPYRHGQTEGSAMDAVSARRVDAAGSPVQGFLPLSAPTADHLECTAGRLGHVYLGHWAWCRVRVPQLSTPMWPPTLLGGLGGRGVSAPGPYLLAVAEEDVGKRQ